MHAREVSLHDLNVLHHGLGFTGPLCLRLRTALPRFILRYRSLQHQTTRNVVAGAPSRSADDRTSSILGQSLYINDFFWKTYELTVIQAVEGQERTNQEATNEDNPEGFTETGAEHVNAETISHSHAEVQGGETEHEDEAYEEYADAQEYFHTSEDADAREADQVVANDEPESVLEVDVTHEDSDDPESTEYDELRENEVSGDTEVTGLITASSTQAAPNPESDVGRTVPSESRKPIAVGDSVQLAVSTGRFLISSLHLSLVANIL